MAILHVVAKRTSAKDSAKFDINSVGEQLRRVSIVNFGRTYHLNAENFILSQSFLPEPPRLGDSQQTGHKPT